MTSVAHAEVIGDPIEHSKSPLIHEYWLRRLGLPGEYRRTLVTAAKLRSSLASRQADPGWRGCNVTMPLKRDALLLADSRSDTAVLAGAANILVPRGGALHADNSDVIAVVKVVARLAADPGRHAVTLLGTGGAARAVLVALARLGMHHVGIHARSAAEAAKLTERFGLTLAPKPLGAPVETEGLINATPLGMAGAPPLVVDLAAMPKNGWVFDLVSVPQPTPLVRQAEQLGLLSAGGLGMLVEQAAASFPLFFGTEPPRDGESEAELMRRLMQ